jgi:hypothetical protein
MRVHGNFDDVVALLDDAIIHLLNGQYDAKPVNDLRALLKSVTDEPAKVRSLSELSSAAMLSSVFGYSFKELESLSSELESADEDCSAVIQHLNKMATVLESERVTIAHRIGS